MVDTRNRKGSTPKAESYGRAYLQARKHEREKKKQRESQDGRKSTRASVAEIPTPPYLKRVREQEKKSGESTFPINQRARLT